MQRFLGALVLFLAGAVPARLVRAQSTVPASVGERIRVTTPTQHGRYRLVGDVVASRPDTLLVRTADVATPRAIAVADIRTLEVSQGQHGNGGRGMLYGLVIGVSGGALIGGATYQKPNCQGSFLCPSPDSPALDMVAGGILGGLVGVAAGGLWGASHPSERWHERSLGTAPRVGFIPARHGALIALHATI